jgi:hypothetical protein
VFDAGLTVDELSRLRDMAERHGLTIDMTDSVLLRSQLRRP